MSLLFSVCCSLQLRLSITANALWISRYICSQFRFISFPFCTFPLIFFWNGIVDQHLQSSHCVTRSVHTNNDLMAVIHSYIHIFTTATTHTQTTTPFGMFYVSLGFVYHLEIVAPIQLHYTSWVQHSVSTLTGKKIETTKQIANNKNIHSTSIWTQQFVMFFVVLRCSPTPFLERHLYFYLHFFQSLCLLPPTSINMIRFGFK